MTKQICTHTLSLFNPKSIITYTFRSDRNGRASSFINSKCCPQRFPRSCCRCHSWLLRKVNHQKNISLLIIYNLNNVTPVEHHSKYQLHHSSLKRSTPSFCKHCLQRQTWNLSKNLHRRILKVKNFTPSISPYFNSFSGKKHEKMSENGEIYSACKNFTLPPALTAWTNSTSVSISI